MLSPIYVGRGEVIMKNENRIREVYSLNLICYLRLKGIEKDEVGYNEFTKKVYYYYEPSRELDEAIGEYRDSDTLVRLQGFITEFRKIKDEIGKYKREFER